MDGFDFGISREIRCVKGENVPDAVDRHHRDQVSVVDFGAADLVFRQEAKPFMMNGNTIGQEFELLFEFANA
jgi:hypothetical protein